jgi:hypothetical protein
MQLTVAQVKDMCQQNCVYCDAAPSPDCYGIVRNGIDRKDNSKGYIMKNCVPTCFDCNRHKGKGTEAEFLAHVAKVYEFQKKLNKGERQ